MNIISFVKNLEQDLEQKCVYFVIAVVVLLLWKTILLPLSLFLGFTPL